MEVGAGKKTRTNLNFICAFGCRKVLAMRSGRSSRAYTCGGGTFIFAYRGASKRAHNSLESSDAAMPEKFASPASEVTFVLTNLGTGSDVQRNM